MSDLNIFLIVLAGIASVALALFQYYFRKRKPRWQLFTLLRTITWFCIFLLLINPKFKKESFSVEKPSLVLAVDNSRSINEFDQNQNVLDFIDNIRAHNELNSKFDLDVYSFGHSFQVADTLNFDEGRTNISEAISNLKKLYKTRTAPTILITDGNQTFGRDYEFEAADYDQKIFPVVVGDTTAHADLRIDRLNVNRYAFLNNKFPVEVFVNYEGDQAVATRFTIRSGNSILFSQNLNFDKQKNSEIIMAELQAESVGVHTYTAAVEALSDEKNKVNNTQRFAVEVIDQKTNILLLSAIPHPDLGSLKKAIESNRQRQAEIKYLNDKDLDFGEYQLVVLYQPNQDFKDVYEQIDRLGMNTLTITGTQTEYMFLNNHQHFFEKEITRQKEEYLPVYNSNFGSYQFEDIGFDDFPPLRDRFGDLKIKAAEHTLLYQSISGYKTQIPLMMVAEDGPRRFGYLFGEDSWKWRTKSYVDNSSFEAYDEFIGKLIQYLASGKKRDRLSVDFKSFYNSGDVVVFQTHYFDENYEFDPRAKVFVDVVNQETKKTQRFPFILKSNRYEVNLSSLEAGDYRFTVSVEGTVLTRNGSFTIVDFDIEKQFLNANLSKLQRIASDRVYFTGEEENLAAALLADEKFKPIQKSRITTSPLVDWWQLLIIIALALAVEWFMRKYRGLI